MRRANERRRYIVTSSLIGWAHVQNEPAIPSLSLEPVGGPESEIQVQFIDALHQN